MKDPTEYSVRAVERAARLLKALGAADRPQTLTALAAAVQLSLPTTFRLMRTLQDQELVTFYPEEGRYALGYQILELGQSLLRQLDLVGIARPLLMAARDQLGETTGLAVRSGDDWVYVAHAEASQPLRQVLQIGERLPLYAGAVGKVFLAACPEAELEEYFGRAEFVAFSENTPTDPGVLREQIARTRALGYGESINERGAGGVGIAAPIYANDGRVVAAFSVSGPLPRYAAEGVERWVNAALFNAQQISLALGFRGASDGLPLGRPRASAGPRKPGSD